MADQSAVEESHPTAEAALDQTNGFEALFSYLTTQGLALGSACISCLGSDSALKRTAPLCGVLLASQNSDGRLSIPSLTVIFPPTVSSPDAHALITAGINDFVVQNRGTSLSEAEHSAIANRLRVVHAPDLRSISLAEIIEQTDARSLVLVLDAARYRSENTKPFIAPGSPGPTLPEDFWVPHLADLGRKAIDAAHKTDVFVILDAGTERPYRLELQNQLEEIDDDCGFVSASIANDPMGAIASHVDRWMKLLAEGRMGVVLQELDTIPSLGPQDKLLVRAQILHQSGLEGPALAAIEELLESPNQPTGFAAIRLARISTDAGALPLALRLLKPALTDLTSLEELEYALSIAQDLDDRDLEEAITARLSTLHGDSPRLRQQRFNSLIAQREYRAAAEVLNEDPADGEAATFFMTLADAFNGPGIPDYFGVLATMRKRDPDWRARARVACTRDALARRLPVHALSLALPIDTGNRFARASAQNALKVLETLFLERDANKKLVVTYEEIQKLIIQLVQLLAVRPTDGPMRTELSRVLSPSVSGNLGMALVASVVIKFGERPVELVEAIPRSTSDLHWLNDRVELLQPAFDWLRAEAPMVLGRAVLPKELIVGSADDMMSAIVDWIQTYGMTLPDDQVDHFLNWLAIGTAVASHTSDPDQDIRLMRLGAAKLAMLGRSQTARDICQQILLNAGSDIERARMAWFAMADIYQRTGDVLEATIAMACALSTDAPLDQHQALQETTSVIRLLRDLGLTKHALSVLNTAKANFQSFHSADATMHRLETLELQIRQFTLSDEPSRSATELSELLEQALNLGRRMRSINDDVGPVAVLISELTRRASIAGVEIPVDAASILTDLVNRAGPDISSLVRATLAIHPTADDVIEQIAKAEKSTYADDVGFGYRSATLLAQRLLLSEEALFDPKVAVFAIELLADRGVAVPGWETVAAPASLSADLDVPAEVARALSQSGVAVVLAGFDTEGHLVSVVCENGELSMPVRESVDGISLKLVEDWGQDFPYRYGVDEKTANLFLTTTERFRLTNLPTGPTILVADARFQRFPPNLLRIGDAFAGSDRPLAVAPSLTWLQVAREAMVKRDGRELAWISTAEGASGSATLSMTAEWLNPIFEERGMAVETTPAVPKGFANADLVVVVAHGGVVPEGQFFQSVADDASLKVAASALARALSNVGVAILFICSAGRTDKHPSANTTLGLAKALLDRGCSAVVASPWPIDPRITYRWLPAFLEYWDAGAHLIDANFAANAAVATAYPFDAAKTLAMTVYGDPLIKKSFRADPRS